MNFSFSVQHNVGRGIVVDAGYVGSLGRHLWRERDLNWIPFGANFLPENQDPSNPASPLPPSFLRPYIGFAEIPKIEYDATSNYHSLQLNVNRRMARGLQLGGAWTWSKAMDYGQGTNQTPGVISSQLPARWFYSLSDVDRTHILKINWVWDLPNFPSRGKRWICWSTTGSVGHRQLHQRSAHGVGWSTTSAVDVTGTPSESARIVVRKPRAAEGASGRSFKNFRTEVFRAPAVGTVGNAARNTASSARHEQLGHHSDQKPPGHTNASASSFAANFTTRSTTRSSLRSTLARGSTPRAIR